ncbi:type II secretion system protein GspM [Acuticoccus sp.]|uniref:type II secretion system protein GspM n=1 Tax=Acuticoccus sp. TaxID=1904378 RepID=UPI003B51CD62
MTPSSQSNTALRLVAVAAFVALPLVLAGLIAGNLTRAAEGRASLERRAVEVAALEARLARAGPQDGPLRADGALLSGASRALATAALQQHLVGIAADAGARIVEVQDATPDEAEDGDPDGSTPGVMVRLTFEATNEALLTALHRMEVGTPLVVVGALEVRPTGTSDARSQDDPLLRVEVTVRSVWDRRGA